MAAKNTAILLFLTLTTLSLLPLFSSQSPFGGRWKVLKRSVGMSAMHMQLLPNNKLVVFDRTDAGRSNISLPYSHHCFNRTKHLDCTAHSVEFNPDGRAVRPLVLATETFCSSGALLPNGTLIQTGGYGGGDHAVRYFSPCDDEKCDWIEDTQGLVVKRWYSSNHILPDGRVIVLGGRDQFNYEFVPKISPSEFSTFELPFLRYAGDIWENNLYPFLHLAPDGNLFVFANTKSILLSFTNHTVLRTYPEIPGGISRNYPSTGSSVLLPLRLNSSTATAAEVMICGGAETTSFSKAKNGTFLPASNSCGRLVITDEYPEWKMSEMPFGRVMGDMILLPTGDVLIINGAANGTAGWEYGRDPVFTPVLYRTGVSMFPDNTSNVFEIMNPTTIARVYHSTAHLIADGRVIVGGSNPHVTYKFSNVLYPTELSLEAFYPPYLTCGGFRRPKIRAIRPGDQMKYGERISIGFTVKYGSEEEVVRRGVFVTMVAPSFTTHSFSMNQRVLVLEIVRLQYMGGSGYYEVEGLAPGSGEVAPAGWYMVFVVYGGVPSRGEWVHVG